jgi:hypothetical protein
VAPAAPAAPAAPTVPAAPAATTAPPLRGDADGPANAASARTADPLLVGDVDDPFSAATAMTDTGAYILMATKEDLREFGDDLTPIPLVLVYKGVIFFLMIRLHFILVFPLFYRSSMTFFRRRYQQDYHHCVVMSIRLTLFRVHVAKPSTVLDESR